MSLAMQASNIPGWKSLTVTNALAYYTAALITVVKIFIAQAREGEPCIIQRGVIFMRKSETKF